MASTKGDVADKQIRARLAAVVESSDDAIISKSLDGVIQSWNRAAEQIFGYTAEEVIGQPVSILIPPERQAEESQILARVREGQRIDHYQTVRRRKDGSLVNISLTVSPVRDDRGKIIGVSKIARDVTARNRESQARAHLAAIVAFSDDAIISKSLDGIVLTWNQGAERIFGYSEKEMVGQPIALLIPPERYDEEPHILGRIRKGERIDHYETVRRRKDGAEILISLTISPIRNDAGEIIAASKIARDITAQRRAETALRDVQKRLQIVIDSAPMVVFALDHTGIVTLFEGRALEKLGLQSSALVGRSVFALDIAEQTWFSANIKRALAGNERTYTASIGDRWLETRLVPLFDQAGAVVGVSGVALDVTEQRQMQEELARASKLEAIGVLAGGIAHDFNNILTAIVGNLALARLRIDDPNTTKSLIESEKAALRARGLTQQLLTFARGGKPVKKALFLSPLLQSASEFALHGSNTRVQVLAAQDLFPVEADEGQLNQVVHNLVLNAQQAMPQGGVVEIQARNVRLRHGQLPLEPGEYVRIDVIDSGTGIQPEHLPKIFDPFFTTRSTGSGLGLATVYRIITQHGGHVLVESQPGVGTRFQLYLPRAQTDVAPEEPEQTLQPGKGRVLFMDDEATICSFAKEFLTMLGYEVALAEEGGEAVQLYREALDRGQPFDVVILDLTVRGGLGGLETIERLRALDSDVTAIVSSGYSNNTALSDYARFGFAAQVAKPYTVEALGHVLRQTLARRMVGDHRSQRMSSSAD